jgi:mannose-6-phosphate isomerase-like protein (cupin superfamily)
MFVWNTSAVEGIVAGPDGGEKLVRGPRNHRILAELPELEVIELCFGPDFEGVEPHTHTDQTDTFYVLEGEAEFTVGSEVFRGGPGTYVAAPIGVVHGFRNPGPGDLKMLNIHAPNTGFAERMRHG